MLKAISILMLLLLLPTVRADITYFDMSELYNNTGTNSSQPNFSFRLMYNDTSINAFCDILIDDTGFGFNSSVLNNTFTTIQANQTLSDGDYEWKLNCTTNDGFNIESNFTRTFFVDTTPPVVTLVPPTPENATTVRLTNFNPSITINASVSEDVIACYAIIDGQTFDVEVFDGYCSQDIFEWSEKTQNYSVHAFDKANEGVSEERIITTDVVTFVEQNPFYRIVPIMLWFGFALILFGVWAVIEKLSIQQIFHIGIGLTIIMVFIFVAIMTLNLVI